MKVKKRTQLTIKVVGDDIAELKSALEKMIGENKSVGFKTSFSKDELKILNKLNNNL